MNLQSLIVVLLRLMSLNFLLQSSNQFMPLLFRVSMTFQNTQSGDWGIFSAAPWAMVTGSIASAVLIWMFAPAIAALVTYGLPTELSIGTLSLADCYTVIFILFGLVNVIGQFPVIVYWIHFALVTAPSDLGAHWDLPTRSYNILTAGIRFIIGIILIANARKWAVALARQQTQNEAPPPSIPPQAKDVS